MAPAPSPASSARLLMFSVFLCICFLRGNVLSPFVNRKPPLFCSFWCLPVTPWRESQWLLLSVPVALKYMVCEASNRMPGACIRRLREPINRDWIPLFPLTDCFNSGKVVNLSGSFSLWLYRCKWGHISELRRGFRKITCGQCAENCPECVRHWGNIGNFCIMGNLFCISVHFPFPWGRVFVLFILVFPTLGFLGSNNKVY